MQFEAVNFNDSEKAAPSADSHDGLDTPGNTWTTCVGGGRYQNFASAVSSLFVEEYMARYEAASQNPEKLQEKIQSAMDAAPKEAYNGAYKAFKAAPSAETFDVMKATVLGLFNDSARREKVEEEFDTFRAGIANG